MRKSEGKTQRLDVCYLAVVVSAKPFWFLLKKTTRAGAVKEWLSKVVHAFIPE